MTLVTKAMRVPSSHWRITLGRFFALPGLSGKANGSHHISNWCGSVFIIVPTLRQDHGTITYLGRHDAGIIHVRFEQGISLVVFFE